MFVPLFLVVDVDNALRPYALRKARLLTERAGSPGGEEVDIALDLR